MLYSEALCGRTHDFPDIEYCKKYRQDFVKSKEKREEEDILGLIEATFEKSFPSLIEINRGIIHGSCRKEIEISRD